MIYVVAGFMRSGTSMMMQACEAGGMDVLKSQRRDSKTNRKGEDNFRPNPVSLYEVPMKEMQLVEWPRSHDGKAIKTIGGVASLMCVHEYQAVFMRRDSEEIRQSYHGAFGHNIPIEAIDENVKEALAVLRNRRDVLETIELNYVDVLSDPEGELSKLGWPMDVEAAAQIIDPEQYRFRKERLVVGL